MQRFAVAIAVVATAVAGLGWLVGPSEGAAQRAGAACTAPNGAPGHFVVNEWGISVCVPDAGEEESSSPGHGSPASGGGQPDCPPAGCVTADGTWFASHSCYAQVINPQPPASDIFWPAGQGPDDGDLWECTPSHASASGLIFFVANGEAPGLVDPAVLAQNALDSMRFETANVQVTPPPDLYTYVNVDNWLWVPHGQWRTLSLTVTAGATSVTVTAEPQRVEWNMGPETVSCMDAGKQWRKGMSDEAKTSCSYAYKSLEDPEGEEHEVSARIEYAASWTCSGACLTSSGDLGEVLAPAGETASVTVYQRQTVVTGQ